nr:MAG TPA: hypothetical protein [Bacteriophage sp.]
MCLLWTSRSSVSVRLPDGSRNHLRWRKRRWDRRRDAYL